MALTIKDFPARLEAFLADLLPGARVAWVRQLTGGASRDTWAVDVEGPSGPQRLVVRRDMGGEIQPEALDRSSEFAVLRRAHEGGARVPRPRWVCMDPAVLGAPFLVMDRLEGESVGRRVVRDVDLVLARGGERLLDRDPHVGLGGVVAHHVHPLLAQDLVESGIPQVAVQEHSPAGHELHGAGRSSFDPHRHHRSRAGPNNPVNLRSHE